MARGRGNSINIKASKKLAEGEDGGQKHSEVRPQGGQVYNYKALQHVAGEPAVLAFVFPWEQVFSHVGILYLCCSLFGIFLL